MTEEQVPKVEKNLYVNEATLELIRRRIESDVKKGFLRSIGAPVGGAGILAILYMLFIWIPGNLGTLINENPQIQDKIQTSVTEYLNKEEGKKLVEKLVVNNMGTDAIKQQISETVRSALQPAIERLSNKIHDNVGLLVSEIKDFPEGPDEFSKGSIHKLNKKLKDKDYTDPIKKSQKPLVLTLIIQIGPKYADYAIREYIRRLDSEFKSQFGHILIKDYDHKFLALINRDEFLEALDHDLMQFLNKHRDNLTTEQAKDFLEDRFGIKAVKAISTSWKIGQALLDPLWLEITSDDQWIAVIDESGNFEGLTTRDKMIIDGILG